MADITANPDSWSSTEASNSPSGSTTIGTGLDDNLRAIQAGFKVWAARLPVGQYAINGRITASVGSSALTLALKGKDGNDPSATNKVYIAFPSSTASSSDWNIREVTSALSVVVSSGSTLGHADGKACHLFVYAIDNAGTVELAVSNLPPDYPGTFADARLISTTAEGGAGAADSATGIYSTTARSNVPWVCLAKAKSTQTTAGTWAAVPTQLDMAPFSIPRNLARVTLNGDQTITNATWTKMTFVTEVWDIDSVHDGVTNFRYQPNVAGYYNVGGHLSYSSGVNGQRMLSAVYKNGSQYGYSFGMFVGAGDQGVRFSDTVLMNGTSDYIEIYTYQDTGGSKLVEWGSTTAHSYAAFGRIAT